MVAWAACRSRKLLSDPYVKDYHGRQVGALARALGLVIQNAFTVTYPG
jgi:hypothetical protein